jgi:dTDP-4-amino-4,6-dideoxygalactose transaminase
MTSELAIFGGSKAVQTDVGDIFDWPLITEEDEEAALEVLRAGNMSGTDVTTQFEEEFAQWHGVKHALAFNNGTSSLHSAMFACGVGVGDEIICQSNTIFASIHPAMNLGATIIFADTIPDTLTLDPEDVERKITPRTKAIVAVHLYGHPTDMDPIMELANRYGIKVIEDVSHAHGALYKGKLVGTIGHIAAMSIMTYKALPVGEGGIVITDDRDMYERAVAFGHSERTGADAGFIEDEELNRYAGLPLGGFNYRMHQLSSAVGRVQLRHYRERMGEIQKSMNYFWDLLDDVPGVKAHRPPQDSGSTMGGWYTSVGLYASEELDGLSNDRFCEAVRAEGVNARAWSVFEGDAPPPRTSWDVLLHTHPVFNEADIYRHGKPTRFANVDYDPRQPEGSLPAAEKMSEQVYSIPWFKHYRPQIIEEHATAFRKVSEHANELSDS